MQSRSLFASGTRLQTPDKDMGAAAAPEYK